MPALIFCVVIPKISTFAIIDFISTALGAVWGGFSVIYFINKIQRKYEWIVVDLQGQIQ